MKYVNTNVMSGADTASLNGPQIDSNQLISASFHGYFGDGSAAGTIKIQASNDIDNSGYLQAFTVVNWVDIPNATATVAAGAPALITLTQISYRWMRVVYTRASGGSTTVAVNMFAVSI